MVTIEAWRFAIFGSNSTDPSIAGDDADPDGDVVSNLQEFQAGSNPLDASSVPAPVSAHPVSKRGKGPAR